MEESIRVQLTNNATKMHTNLGMYTERTPNRKEFSMNSVNTKHKEEGVRWARVYFETLQSYFRPFKFLMGYRKNNDGVQEEIHFFISTITFFRLFLFVSILFFFLHPYVFHLHPKNL